MSETVFRVGPTDWKPTVPRAAPVDAHTCRECHGEEWRAVEGGFRCARCDHFRRGRPGVQSV